MEHGFRDAGEGVLLLVVEEQGIPVAADIAYAVIPEGKLTDFDVILLGFQLLGSHGFIPVGIHIGVDQIPAPGEFFQFVYRIGDSESRRSLTAGEIQVCKIGVVRIGGFFLAQKGAFLFK